MQRQRTIEWGKRCGLRLWLVIALVSGASVVAWSLDLPPVGIRRWALPGSSKGERQRHKRFQDSPAPTRVVRPQKPDSGTDHALRFTPEDALLCSTQPFEEIEAHSPEPTRRIFLASFVPFRRAPPPDR